MRKLYLLTHEDAGRLMQFRVLTVKQEPTTLNDFLKKGKSYYGCLVEMDMPDKTDILRFENCLGISLPIMQTNSGKVVYGATYLTDKSEWLKKRFEV